MDNRLEEKMLLIVNNYFAARRLLSDNREMSDDNFSILCSYVNNVRKAFNTLNDEEKIFLNNEYFFQAPLDWWKKIWNQEKYQKMKEVTLNHFLGAFYVRY